MHAFNTDLEWAAKLFNSVKAGIVIIDPDTRTITDINNQALIMLGSTHDKITNTPCKDCFIDKYNGKCPVLDLGLDIEDEELLLQRADGSKLIISRTISTILYKGKKYLVESFLDITKLKDNDERMSALLRISESVLKSEEDIIRLALDEAVKLTRSKIGYLYFVLEDNKKNELADLNLFVCSSEIFENCQTEIVQDYLLTNAKILAECIQTQKPILCNNCAKESGKKCYKNNYVPVNRFMSVPIINGNENIVAVMGVCNKDTPYVDFDIKQLQLFANSMWSIVKRKRIQLDLIKSERQYRNLVEQSPAAIYEIDLTELKIITADGNIEKLSGFKKEELLKVNPVELLLPEDSIKFMNRINKLVKGESVSNRVEYRIRVKDGSVRNVLLQVSHRVRKSDGHIIAYVIASDITDLRRAEAKAETYFNLTPALILVLDLEGNIESINKYGCEILECNMIDVIGRNWFDLFIPDHEQKKVKKVFRNILTKKTKFSEVENDVITTKGNKRVIAWRSSVLLTASGEIENIIMSGDDLTDQRMAEKELEKYWISERIRLQKNLDKLSLLGQKRETNDRF